MGDDDEALLARKGLRLLERAEQVSPAAAVERVKDAAAETAKDAVLGGMALLDELTGGKEAAAPRPSAAAVEAAHARLDAASIAEYDERLRRAASRHAQTKEARTEEARAAHDPAAELARLRRSFPPEARELATLLFACADLLEDLADEAPPPAAELAKKEVLLARIAELLAPRADAALAAFVGHVTALSRARRGG
jgi:hypothetical protein